MIVYYLLQHPVRDTIIRHLYSFRRFSRNRYFYLNMAVRDVPRWVEAIPFDLVIFHNSFLGARWAPELLIDLRRRASPLRRVGMRRVALPQDEFLHADALAELIDEFAIDTVYSVAPESEWPKIYAAVKRPGVRFERVLTGYLDPRTVRQVTRLSRERRERTVDVGYRAWRGAYWLGRHGALKGEIATQFEHYAGARPVSLDISTRDEDTLYGEDWYRFLLSCKYTLGVEGGASLLDRDGSVRARTEAYLTHNPGASFSEVEKECFTGVDGNLKLTAISPRHLEACLTKTCQILVEGTYNGILRPGEHYIELRRDLSNMDAVVASIERDDRRHELTEAAFRDIVASGRYSYGSFVTAVEETALAGSQPQSRPMWRRLQYAVACSWNRIYDWRSWMIVIRRLRIPPGAAHLVITRLLPAPVLTMLRLGRRSLLRLRP